MKRPTKKRIGTQKNRAKQTPAQRRAKMTKLLVVALATRARKAGTKKPNTGRPPLAPVAKIKGNAYPGAADAAYCAAIGTQVDQAVDDMEQAIINDDEAALQEAIAEFNNLWDHGHSSGCYFSYV